MHCLIRLVSNIPLSVLHLLFAPDARKLQEHIGRSLPWDSRWRQVSQYLKISLK